MRMILFYWASSHPCGVKWLLLLTRSRAYIAFTTEHIHSKSLSVVVVVVVVQRSRPGTASSRSWSSFSVWPTRTTSTVSDGLTNPPSRFTLTRVCDQRTSVCLFDCLFVSVQFWPREVSWGREASLTTWSTCCTGRSPSTPSSSSNTRSVIHTK